MKKYFTLLALVVWPAAAQLTVIQGTDQVSASRTVINDNFAALAAVPYVTISCSGNVGAEKCLSDLGVSSIIMKWNGSTIVAAVADTDFLVPATAANTYLPKAGGTMTGQIVTDNLGIEFEEADVNPTCAAGAFNVYADLSENKLKKCQNGAVTDLDTGGEAGTGDAGTFTSVNYSATPTFTASSNTIDTFRITLTGNVTSSTLASPTAGQFLVFQICQDGTGNRTFAWPTEVNDEATVVPTANACTHQAFFYNGTAAIPTSTAVVTGIQGSALYLNGATSGTLTVQPQAIASGTLEFPNGAGTLARTSDNVATATALAANPANCVTGFPNGVDAAGAPENCTALPTTISGTANEITASAATGPVTLSLPATLDLGGKAVEIPNAASLGSCAVGQIKMDTDATSGQRLYLCESTDTWVLQGDGNAGGANNVTAASSFATDNRLIRSDGTGRGAQSSGVTVDDSDNVTVPGFLAVTGVLTTGITGVDITDSDSNPACAAGEYKIYADTSENKLKKCMNGSATDLDTTGGTPSFATLTGGTNVSAAMLVGNGASLAPTGSGTIEANVAPTEAYDATNWNSDTAPPQKDAVRDKFEALAPAGVVADGAIAAKYKTWSRHFKLWGTGALNVLQDGDDELSVFRNEESSRTITKVVCESDAGTPTIQLQKDDGSPVNMFSSAITCNTSPSGTDGTTGILNSFVSGENVLATGVRLDYLSVAAGSSTHWVAITISGTID